MPYLRTNCIRDYTGHQPMLGYLTSRCVVFCAYTSGDWNYMCGPSRVDTIFTFWMLDNIIDIIQNLTLEVINTNYLTIRFTMIYENTCLL